MLTTKPTIKIKEYQAIEPSVQVDGTTIIATLQGSAAKSLTEKILVEEGLPAEPSAALFYSQQKWLNVLRRMHERYGDLTLKMVGKKIPETAKFPPQIDNIEAGLQSIGVAYQMNHRGGEIGYYRFQKTGDREGYVEASNPYPCDFDMGIVEGMARRFAPTAAVRHEEGECRKTGGSLCRYYVKW